MEQQNPSMLIGGNGNEHVKIYNRKSRTHTVLLEKQAATLSPSRFQQTSKIPPLPRYVFTRLPSLTDQMWRHLSNDPLARYSPLGLKATEYTGSLQPRQEKNSYWEAMLHRQKATIQIIYPYNRNLQRTLKMNSGSRNAPMMCKTEELRSLLHVPELDRSIKRSTAIKRLPISESKPGI